MAGLAVLQLAALALFAGATARTQPFGVRSKPLEEVDRDAGWKVSGDRKKDLVLNSLFLEAHSEFGTQDALAGRRLQSAGCSSDATATCAALPAAQQNAIRAVLIASCSTLLPSGQNAISNCCNTVRGSSQQDFTNNAACLCGDAGGLSAYVPQSHADTVLQQCQPNSASNPAGPQPAGPQPAPAMAFNSSGPPPPPPPPPGPQTVTTAAGITFTGNGGLLAAINQQQNTQGGQNGQSMPLVYSSGGTVTAQGQPGDTGHVGLSTPTLVSSVGSGTSTSTSLSQEVSQGSG